MATEEDMIMDGVEVLAFLSLILLLASGGLVLALAFGRTSGRGTRIATWLALTVLAVWVVFVAEFIVVYGVLFTLGQQVATVALAVAAIILVLTPVATGLVVNRIAHHPGH
jgi:hypothetical protein